MFLYDSGVQGLRIENELGHIIALPYQGQQIWDCCFLGRNLTMKSMFTDPVPNVGYLQSYGAFLLHCGATAMGVPSKTDTHPLHGELPNAVYERAWLEIGEDEKGSIFLCGDNTVIVLPLILIILPHQVLRFMRTLL